MSLALREDLNRLDCILLPGRWSVGTLGCGQAMAEWDIPFAEGDIDGVNGVGDMTDTEDGEPGRRFMAAAISMAEAADAAERGEGTAEPVET